MSDTYEETYLRKYLSKYANERIQSVGYEGDRIKIRFKEGFGTSVFSGTVHQELLVKTISYMKEACQKARLIEGERVLKGTSSYQIKKKGCN